jgi:D-threo-aldose 1-dehydrogenase
MQAGHSRLGSNGATAWIFGRPGRPLQDEACDEPSGNGCCNVSGHDAILRANGSPSERTGSSMLSEGIPRVRVGRTLVEVSRLGLGTGPLGGWPTPIDPATAIATVQTALEIGIRHIDTAPLYGYGQAESFVGKALHGQPRDSFTISTKVGRRLEPAFETEAQSFFKGTGRDVRPIFDFSRDGVRRSIDSSLSRLGLDRIDILLIHDPDDHLDSAAEGAYAALADLRSDGVVGAVGAGMNRTKPLVHLIGRLDLDCVMVAGRYSLLDQTAGHELLPLARKRGVSVFAAGVFNSGILAGEHHGATFDYKPAAPNVAGKAHRLRAIADPHGVSLGAAAIQYSLAHPAVASAVVGSRTPEEIAQNVAWMRVVIPRTFWIELIREGLLDEHAVEFEYDNESDADTDRPPSDPRAAPVN